MKSQRSLKYHFCTLNPIFAGLTSRSTCCLCSAARSQLVQGHKELFFIQLRVIIKHTNRQNQFNYKRANGNVVAFVGLRGV